MLLSALLAACTLGLATACTTGPDGACSVPEVSTCVVACYGRKFNTSCLAAPGCTWNATGCFPTDPTLDTKCANQSLSANCGNITGCFWNARQCPTVQTCDDSVNGPDPDLRCAGAGSNASSCAALGTPCQMENRCLTSKYEECSFNKDNQAGCTATAGCFWIKVGQQYANGTAKNTTNCLHCLYDPGTSFFFRYRDLLGQTCSEAKEPNSTFEVLQATASATGCATGWPLPMYAFAGGDVTCSASSGATGYMVASISSSFAVVAAFSSSLLLA